jgi:hypothetical protein
VPDSWFHKIKKKPLTIQEQMDAANKAAEKDITPSESLTQSLIAMREYNANAQPIPKFER